MKLVDSGQFVLVEEEPNDISSLQKDLLTS
jgi:hypothetical protein